MKIGQKPTYALFARRPSFVFLLKYQTDKNLMQWFVPWHYNAKGKRKGSQVCAENKFHRIEYRSVTSQKINL